MGLLTFVLAAWPAVFVGADAKIPGYHVETEKVVARALKQYDQAKSYQDNLLIKVDFEAESSNPEALSPPEDKKFTLAFADPNKLALKTPVFDVYCDGKKLSEHIADLEQYVESAASKQLDLNKLDVAKFNVFSQFRHPLSFVLSGTATGPKALFGEVARFTGTKKESLAGRPGRRVSGIVKIEVARNTTQDVPFSAWFSDETGLVEVIEYDHSEWMRERSAAMPANANSVKISKYVERLSFTEIEINKPIPDEVFGFKPGKYDLKVAQFIVPTGNQTQQRLVGRTAPQFSGQDLDGKPLNLSDLKGQVVLLDFWASWCGPCVMAMPIIQKVADKYAARPVTVIGVNSDGPTKRAQILRFLADRKISFRHFADDKEEVNRAYRISSIPCMVLIDGKGIIQAVHAGLAPDEEQRLSSEIDQLLAGKNLFAEPAGSAK